MTFSPESLWVCLLAICFVLAVLAGVYLGNGFASALVKRRLAKTMALPARCAQLNYELKRVVDRLEKQRDNNAPLAQPAVRARLAASKALEMSELACQHNAWHRSWLHARTGLLLSRWCERLLECQGCDDADGQMTDRLLFGFQQLASWSLPESESSFRQILQIRGVDPIARKIALAAHSWILDYWGFYAEAENEAWQSGQISC